MVAALEKPDAGKAALPRALHNGLHQQAANPGVLLSRLNRNWPNTGNRVALIQKIRTDDAAVDLRYDVEKSWVTDHVAEQASRNVWRRQIRNEIVCFGDGLKCAIANRARLSGVGLTAPS